MPQHRLCAENDLRVGEKKAFSAGDMTIILYRLKDGFYATQRLCTHTFAPLDKGKVVDGDAIQCLYTPSERTSHARPKLHRQETSHHSLPGGRQQDPRAGYSTGRRQPDLPR